MTMPRGVRQLGAETMTLIQGLALSPRAIHTC